MLVLCGHLIRAWVGCFEGLRVISLGDVLLILLVGGHGVQGRRGPSQEGINLAVEILRHLCPAYFISSLRRGIALSNVCLALKRHGPHHIHGMRSRPTMESPPSGTCSNVRLASNSIPSSYW